MSWSLLGDSNVNRLQAFNRNANWRFIEISGVDLIKYGKSVTQNIVKQLPPNKRYESRLLVRKLSGYSSSEIVIHRHFRRPRHNCHQIIQNDGKI